MQGFLDACDRARGQRQGVEYLPSLPPLLSYHFYPPPPFSPPLSLSLFLSPSPLTTAEAQVCASHESPGLDVGV